MLERTGWGWNDPTRSSRAPRRNPKWNLVSCVTIESASKGSERHARVMANNHGAPSKSGCVSQIALQDNRRLTWIQL